MKVDLGGPDVLVPEPHGDHRRMSVSTTYGKGWGELGSAVSKSRSNLTTVKGNKQLKLVCLTTRRSGFSPLMAEALAEYIPRTY